MALGPSIYGFLSRYWRSELGMKIKDRLRPVKHFLVGKNAIYKAIERVQELEKFVNRDVKVMFDVGAAIGETTLPMLKAFPNAEIFCFEPVPSQFDRLKKRTEKFSSRIKYFNCALYDKNDEFELNIRPDHPDASTFINESGNFDRVIVKRKRLDDVVKEFGISKIDFMKVDVEGVEREVFRGGQNALNITDNIFVEIAPLRKGVHNHDYIDTFECLHQAGFSLGGVYGDYFFTKLIK